MASQVSQVKDMESRERSLSESSYGRSRTASMIGCRVVLLAVDASPHAKAAFEWFLDNVHQPSDYLLIVHCPETPKLPSFSFKSGMAPPVEEWKKVLDDMNAKTRMVEEDYEGMMIQKKIKYKVRCESFKKPGEGIIQMAHEERADLICMGTRGLGAVKRAFIGSVSEYVTRHTTVPIIIVPSKKK